MDCKLRQNCHLERGEKLRLAVQGPVANLLHGAGFWAVRHGKAGKNPRGRDDSLQTSRMPSMWTVMQSFDKHRSLHFDGNLVTGASTMS